MARKKKKAKKAKKRRLAVDLPDEMLEQCRDLVVYFQRTGTAADPQSLAGLIQGFVQAGLAKTMKKHGLTKVPARPVPLRQGRPLK